MDIQTGYNWIEQGQGVYLVLSPEHKQYTVNLNDSTCTCPRFAYLNGRPCKHIEYMRRETAPKPPVRTRAARTPRPKPNGLESDDLRAAFNDEIAANLTLNLNEERTAFNERVEADIAACF